MNFLTNKERTVLGLINRDQAIPNSEKAAVSAQVKQNARMRSDGFRAKVKIALHVIANHNNEKILSKYIK
ncbi:hypothetical protein [Pedobacter ureilyticus]|uniref:Uncharacterized protein n=1 Tax=Pedobacter ureilyticus TaxID=1393051 RepID=A0ABW9J1S3_9SPHI|nr:hypothetical protein [Pedobacter helvus]